ncbi:hypothetical protein BX600DRAFT_448043 [Xylariales sp. PMI_506]|nr:hypothetical protein BX600DRAFT_448043 [Xylariales sp. PMI_506]
MSIDLNWETLTGGPDGAALAGSIRDFIHTKFQAVPLPRFIKSVTVHDFQFGSVPPKVVLKDICDPLPDFYEENEIADELDPDEDEDAAAAGSGEGPSDGYEAVPDAIRAAERRRREEQRRRFAPDLDRASRSGSPAPPGFQSHIHTAGLRSAPGTPADLSSSFLSLGVSTPGIPGGTANMHYFPSHMWSNGTQTPLAAVAGAQHHLNGWLESSSGHHQQHQFHPNYRTHPPIHSPQHSRNPSQSSISIAEFSSSSLAPAPPLKELREKHSVSTLAPTSAGASRPPTRDTAPMSSAIDEESESDGVGEDGSGGSEDEQVDAAGGGSHHRRKFREPRVEDMQAVFRIKYAGDVKLMLTADILLDYPMPSFVGIPVKLNITGLSFDGVGVLANIRKRVHFCFLSPEDAVTAIGTDDNDFEDEEEHEGGAPGEHQAVDGESRRSRGRIGGLLQEIKVESEIGQREGTKQSLKNVGKVERFVLEQVRRIFEEEFVYPSFWTFLV